MERGVIPRIIEEHNVKLAAICPLELGTLGFSNSLAKHRDLNNMGESAQVYNFFICRSHDMYFKKDFRKIGILL